MKTIGLIGGMSWESTVTYYEIINTEIKERLGGLHSAKCILVSVDFGEIESNMSKGRWDENAKILSEAAINLEKAGAECVLICTNTLHKVADQVQARISVPLLHIASQTALALKQQGIKKAALLGTKYTMEQDFYQKKLQASGIDVIVPDKDERAELNRIIFEELCLGIISDVSKAKILEIIIELNRRGAGAIILGCTELGLIVTSQDTKTPLFDTAVIHAQSASEFALSE